MLESNMESMEKRATRILLQFNWHSYHKLKSYSLETIDDDDDDATATASFAMLPLSRSTTNVGISLFCF